MDDGLVGASDRGAMTSEGWVAVEIDVVEAKVGVRTGRQAPLSIGRKTPGQVAHDVEAVGQRALDLAEVLAKVAGAGQLGVTSGKAVLDDEERQPREHLREVTQRIA